MLVGVSRSMLRRHEVEVHGDENRGSDAALSFGVDRHQVILSGNLDAVAAIVEEPDIGSGQALGKQFHLLAPSPRSRGRSRG